MGKPLAIETYKKVQDVKKRFPNATQKELALLAGVSLATLKRHLNQLFTRSKRKK